jgi:hypothetical protein
LRPLYGTNRTGLRAMRMMHNRASALGNTAASGKPVSRPTAARGMPFTPGF